MGDTLSQSEIDKMLADLGGLDVKPVTQKPTKKLSKPAAQNSYWNVETPKPISITDFVYRRKRPDEDKVYICDCSNEVMVKNKLIRKDKVIYTVWCPRCNSTIKI